MHYGEGRVLGQQLHHFASAIPILKRILERNTL